MRFHEIIGQQSVKKRLINSVNENRVSHAQLFYGPEGCGNLPLALAYAQYLVCEKPLDDDSCGACQACRKMEKLVHPDVTFSYPIASKVSKPRSSDYAEEWRKAIVANPYIDYNDWVETLDIENKQGIISAEECNDIIRRLSYKSVEAPYRVVIVWYPERLYHAAAPKLLKILEEPPSQTVFLLVASNVEQILATILSRTQLVKINPISDDELSHALQTRHELAADVAKRITHRANGSYHEALMQLDHDAAVEDDAAIFLRWMRYCLKANVKGISDFAVEMAAHTREKQKLFLQSALFLARECVLINYGDQSMIRLDGKDLESYRRFAPFVNRNNAEQFAGELNRAHFHIERNANSKILFTDLSFTINRLLAVNG